MDWKRRRWRLALLLGVAVAVLWAAWRTEERRAAPTQPDTPECVQGRQVERDASGAVTKITRGYCGE